MSLFQLITYESIYRDTVGDLFRRLRNIASLLIDKQNIKLGGDGLIIEIDESLAAKVKHHREKHLIRKQVWIFAIKERNNDKLYQTDLDLLFLGLYLII